MSEFGLLGWSVVIFVVGIVMFEELWTYGRLKYLHYRLWRSERKERKLAQRLDLCFDEDGHLRDGQAALATKTFAAIDRLKEYSNRTTCLSDQWFPETTV